MNYGQTKKATKKWMTRSAKKWNVARVDSILYFFRPIMADVFEIDNAANWAKINGWPACQSVCRPTDTDTDSFSQIQPLQHTDYTHKLIGYQPKMEWWEVEVFVLLFTWLFVFFDCNCFCIHFSFSSTRWPFRPGFIWSFGCFTSRASNPGKTQNQKQIHMLSNVRGAMGISSWGAPVW